MPVILSLTHKPVYTLYNDFERNAGYECKLLPGYKDLE